MTVIRDFLTTLGFLTRLAPPRVASDEEMRRTMPWTPAVGLALGIVIALPFALGLLDGRPWVQAWLVVLASLWLTRGLHYDGIADVCDAFTAHFDPERFWTVIKDSRCGAFGVLALVLVVAGQIVLFADVLTHHAAWVLVWPFVAGRLNCVLFGILGKDYARPGLGSLFYAGATTNAVAVNVLAAFAVGAMLLPIKGILLTYALLAVTLIPLHKLAKDVSGANGDFLGASIVLGELSALLGIVVVG
ncbi:adenosylcobinamide-GDP ribazoletransferase [Salidesulfovibrio brasiliensis]|uniref:adenosylcobinamide-GDP ribazoletransferase n=1 Tax=Salidesulfovibrio brasiliensis TaxID=221711 RepID=UPI0006D22A24|nr:adenosylcobinamide-GDP ribazoletransferase [Salidesulfovibrio brasiliensis]